LKKKNKLIEKLKKYFQKVHNFKEIIPNELTIFSSVAIILREKASNLEILFIKRTERDKDIFSGHMAFPGGVKEKMDEDILSTTIRETSEEIGLNLNQHGELIGRFDDYKPVNPSANNFIVSPFIFYLIEPNFKLVKNSDEVKDIVWISLDKLKTLSSNSMRTINKFDALYQDYVFNHKNYTIWGMTGKILYSFINKINNIK